MKQKLQNSKGNTESLEFLPALRLFIFKKSQSQQLKVNYISSSLDYNFFVHTYIIFLTPTRSHYPACLQAWVTRVCLSVLTQLYNSFNIMSLKPGMC